MVIILHISLVYNKLFSDYGFTAKPTSNGGFSCSPMNGFNLSLVCPPGQEYYYQSISGSVTYSISLTI